MWRKCLPNGTSASSLCLFMSLLNRFVALRGMVRVFLSYSQFKFLLPHFSVILRTWKVKCTHAHTITRAHSWMHLCCCVHYHTLAFLFFLLLFSCMRHRVLRLHLRYIQLMIINEWTYVIRKLQQMKARITFMICTLRTDNNEIETISCSNTTSNAQLWKQMQWCSEKCIYHERAFVFFFLLRATHLILHTFFLFICFFSV